MDSVLSYLFFLKTSSNRTTSDGYTSVSNSWSSFNFRVHILLDYAVQTAGPMYIILAFSLISSVIFLFFTTVLPAVHKILSLQGLVHILLSSWLIYNVFFNYYWCIHTDPGSPPITFEVGEDLSKYDTAPGAPQIRWCKRCRKPKPPMTHHCHICKRCILKMDHHCPWMNNCIGFYNYRYFFLFLAYLWAGCIYTTVMASIPLFGSTKFSFHQEPTRINGVLFTFILAFAVFGSLSALLGWHMYLVLTAQTTIDFYNNRQHRQESRRSGQVWVNEFHLGMVQNFRIIFDQGGRVWWLQFLLPLKALPRGDGTCFPTRNSSLDGHNNFNQSHPYSLSSNHSISVSTSSREVTTLDRALTEDNWRTSEMV